MGDILGGLTLVHPQSNCGRRRSSRKDGGADVHRCLRLVERPRRHPCVYIAGFLGEAIQREELGDSANTFIIAEDDGQFAGYAQLRLGTPPRCVTGERPVEVGRLYAVDPGGGVGSELMSACLELAARDSRDTIWLGVWERNQKAIAFYERWGFAVVGTHEFILGSDPQVDRVMSRHVSEG